MATVILVGDLLVEGVASAWLPCSAVVLAPGALVVLPGPLPRRAVALGAFTLALLTMSWLRFSGLAGARPAWSTAVLLAGAGLLLVAPTRRPGRRSDLRSVTAPVTGFLVGLAAASLWQPCVGERLGTLLTGLPGRGVAGAAELAVYLAGLLVPLAGLVAAAAVLPDQSRRRAAATAPPPPATDGDLRPAPDRLADPAARMAGGTLAVLAGLTALGLHDRLIGALVAWSS